MSKTQKFEDNPGALWLIPAVGLPFVGMMSLLIGSSLGENELCNNIDQEAARRFSNSGCKIELRGEFNFNAQTHRYEQSYVVSRNDTTFDAKAVYRSGDAPLGTIFRAENVTIFKHPRIK